MDDMSKKIKEARRIFEGFIGHKITDAEHAHMLESCRSFMFRNPEYMKLIMVSEAVVLGILLKSAKQSQQRTHMIRESAVASL